jgi:choice-of-anchor B domain-containing protein
VKRRHLFCLLFLILTAINNAQEIKNIELLDNWFEDSIITSSSLARYNGCWGFNLNDNEYAIIGSTEGTHFFQLTENDKLKNCGFIEGKYASGLVVHREFKTYRNYAYSVCDEGGSSLQIIDLSHLPDSVVKVADIQNEFFGKVHNIFIDTTYALLYACSVTPIINGLPQSLIPLRVFSIQNPIQPVLLWEGPNDIPEVHDCFVQNNIAFLNCGFDGIRIYNFSNPSAPIYLNNLNFYQDQGYNHQGWLSPSADNYFFTDETSGKRIKKCTVNDQFNLEITHLFGTNYLQNSIPHNLICDENFLYVAYYNEGLRIYDIRDVPIEIAAFDTYNSNSTFNMNGAWGVYPFDSGRIIISDRQGGLFLFRFNSDNFLIQPQEDFVFYPNPVEMNSSIGIRTPNDKISNFTLSIHDLSGKLLFEKSFENQTFTELIAKYSPGTYFARICFTNYLGETEYYFKKIVVL